MLWPHSAHGIRADDRTAPDDQASPDAGAEDDAEHHRSAGRRAIGGLRQRQAVGVVGEAHRTAEHPLQVVGKRLAVQPGRVRVLDQAGGWRDRAWHADAHRAASARRHFAAAHQFGDGRQGAVVVVPRRGQALPVERFAVVVECERLDLRAAQVDSDTHGRAAG
jgi:hypothetical protein